MKSDFIETCAVAPCSLTPYPLIFTFAFAFPAQFWCARCGKTYSVPEALDSQLPETIVNQYSGEFHIQAARYLFAVWCDRATRENLKVKFNGRWVWASRLPRAIARENSQILKEWKYSCRTP